MVGIVNRLRHAWRHGTADEVLDTGAEADDDADGGGEVGRGNDVGGEVGKEIHSLAGKGWLD